MYKKILSVSLSIVMALSLGITAFAENSNFNTNTSLSEKYSLNIIDEESAAEIEALVEENNSLKNKINKSEVSTLGISKIQSEINANNARIKELGGKAPSDELLIELIEAEMKQSGVQRSADWHPSELVSDFNDMYDMSGSYATTYAGRTQYHLVFQTKGNDPYLRKVKTDHFYDGISAGSTEARNWVQETIKIYAEKLVGTGLGLANPYLELVPYELLGIAAQPTISAISSPRNATVVTVNTVSIQKFVYVYNTSISEWIFGVSTNKVSMSTTVTQAITVNGRAYNKSVDYNGYWINGDYNNAAADANSVYSTGNARKTCINEVSGYSESKDRDIVTVSIFTPTFVAHMI